MASKTPLSRARWAAAHAAKLGAGHFALVQCADASWRVALIDEWALQDASFQAAFDAVHPDGSLDFCGDYLNAGHLPQDLGRADRFFESRQAECALIDRLWAQGVGAQILAKAPPRWRAMGDAAMPALIRAKAAHRLAQLGSGAPDQAMALLALAGALQENIETCADRARALDADTQSKLDQVDLEAAERRAERRPARRKAGSAGSDGAASLNP